VHGGKRVEKAQAYHLSELASVDALVQIFMSAC
jgi:hypothetical protein